MAKPPAQLPVQCSRTQGGVVQQKTIERMHTKTSTRLQLLIITEKIEQCERWLVRQRDDTVHRVTRSLWNHARLLRAVEYLE